MLIVAFEIIKNNIIFGRSFVPIVIFYLNSYSLVNRFYIRTDINYDAVAVNGITVIGSIRIQVSK